MQNNFWSGMIRLACGAGLLAVPFLLHGAPSPSRGLWVGEVTVSNVNEVVGGINAAGQLVPPNLNPTNTASAAHLRLVLHVDAGGQVRLLKHVAVLNNSTNATNGQVMISLVTDPSLYPNYHNPGQRISSAAFDFGEDKAVTALDHVVDAAASAAAASAGAGLPTATTAANTAATTALGDADVDGNYSTFSHGTLLAAAANGAAAAASAGAVARQNAGGTPQQVLADAQSAATNAAPVVAAYSDATNRQASALFGDHRFVDAVNLVSSAAANGAAATAIASGTAGATGAAATNAAQTALAAAQNALSAASPGYKVFIATDTFTGSGTRAASAAAAGAVSAKTAGGSPTEIANAAHASAKKALLDASVYAAADAVPLYEVKMLGQLAGGQTVAGSLYLGAYHPTNPFRHRRHPDHTIGYEITRQLTLTVDPSPAAGAFAQASYGVDRLTGVYQEEIAGLHKPLGPLQNIGLRTQGSFTLNRLSLVDTLNQ